MLRGHLSSLKGAASTQKSSSASDRRRGRPTKVATQPIASKMPPAISDDEMDSDEGPEQIPAKGKPVQAPVEEEEVDDEDEDEPDEYQVEKIITHDFGEDGAVLYQIKWLGYDKKSDYTWEPVENLESAQEILNDYHVNIGGIPEYEALSSKKKGPKAGSKRSSAVAKLDSPQVTNSSKKTKRKSTNNTAAGAADVTNGDDAERNPTNLPDGTWDHLVRVSSILEEPAVAVKGAKAKGGTILLALLIWDGSGRKTQHPLDVARRKCPQKLLDYYERHLVFKQPALEEESEMVAEEEV